ncbi:MAG TPA: multicopper oxidase domain-containing protein [Anaeromyxobacteraceae bacterium]|nr:multicopper oxidase domain-containing protein [Anaeromyxobacteraceae bacterium]
MSHLTRITRPGAALAVAMLTAMATTATAQNFTPLAPLLPAGQQRFVQELPVPIDYVPDRTTFPGFDYYEVQMSPVTPVAVAFPQAACPAGKQWLGIRAPAVAPAVGAPLCTPVWGYSQTNAAGTYALNGASTYPSMNFRALKGRPVKVKWVNNAPDQHLFCPQPTNPNWPCAIDRTLMGVKNAAGTPVGTFGSTQQPDNAMVVHLHGGEIPPDSDGLAELWFGNVNSSAAYLASANPTAFPTLPVAGSTASATQNIDPPFLTGGISNGVEVGNLTRPVGNSMLYNYPMVQNAAPIWYHDHALGKTRINVAAGPAGFFIVEDPVLEKTLGLPPRGDCSADVTGATGVLKNAGNPALTSNCYDINVAIQDRSFNADGTINFPNGLGQTAPAGIVGWNPLAPGPNPTIHPQWVPEYFGDMAVVNGVIWPKVKVEPRPYRFRLLDGSNARCYELSMKSATLVTVPRWNLIGGDQGYLPAPTKVKTIVMCPGERYDAVVDFTGIPAGTLITVTNSAAAPYPNGIKPTPNGPYGFMGDIMQFVVVAADPTNPPLPATPWVAPATLVARTALPAAAKSRQMVLNEVLDPVTLAPLRVQIDGKPFESAVTETPKRGTIEQWTFVNTTVDAHPMHLHLVQFQVVSRQAYDVKAFTAALGATNPALEVQNYNLAQLVTPFLKGKPRAPEPGETGWKDTARVYPGEVLTVIAKWDGGWADAPTTAPFQSTDPVSTSPTYGTKVAVTVCQVPTGTQPAMTGNPTCACTPDTVNPLICATPETAIMVPAATPFWEPVTAGPYVWHCHIVDHEDNEMMRPVLVVP